MKFNFFIKTFIIGLLVLFVASCDKEFTDIGADIIGDNHYGLDSIPSPVIAYNQNIGTVQTNNLPVNTIGVYNNPIFGKTTASFITQVELASVNPTFFDKPTIEVDSVYLYVPYFSTFQSTDVTSGDSTYKLDSIQKNNSELANNKIKLSVYETNYYLRSFDPATGFTQAQKYFSDQQPDFEATIANGGNILNDATDVSQNDQFEFKSTQIKFFKNNADLTPGTTTVRERLAPGMFLMLNKQFFKDKIINASTDKLVNNNAFKEYFRSLFFKVENASGSVNDGALAKLNFSQGKITIVYKDQISATNLLKEKKTLVLNLSGNTVNTFNNPWTNPVTSPNTTIGDDNLYLKGGVGSMAILELFGGQTNDNATLLNTLRSQNVLINDAYLVFYINKPLLGILAPEPNRVYLYDFTNKRPLLDYFFDITTSPKPKYGKFVHGGIIDKESDGRGTKYKIRITNHIKNLVKFGGASVAKDSTNVKLGLVVTESINNASNANLKTPFTTSGVNNKLIPVMSVINELGTILYGTGISTPEAKKIKLEIYYTKPD